MLSKVGLTLKTEAGRGHNTSEKPVGRDIDDLRFIADILKASERRLVVEDFHYMSVNDRRSFSFDLKALWDYQYFVVIVGVWSETNLLLHLNPDLSGRVDEVSIEWVTEDLRQIVLKGSDKLNIQFSDDVIERLVELAYTNAGVLQQLTLLTLDEAKIEEKQFKRQTASDIRHVDSAALEYSDQLNPVYQQFSKQVSGGIRSRKNSTGIYAYAMATIMEASDHDLINGLSAREIFNKAHARQERIQFGNLKKILVKIPELQVDDDGRGLILTYNTATEEVSVVDRQLLLYRRFATVKWPWEDMIAEADKAGGQLEAE